MLNDFLAKLSNLIEEVKVQEGGTPLEAEVVESPLEEEKEEEPTPPEEPPPVDDGPVRIILEKTHYAPVHELLLAVQERNNKLQENAAKLALAQSTLMSQIYGLEQDTQELIAELRQKYEVPEGNTWELHVPSGPENPDAYFAEKDDENEETTQEDS